ncbi:hypothetical protein FZEAL_6656 [Fusarium zealandicum]|uniref:hydroxymethylglutaryl-CoA reductase (NADPH) n=1 Tax=Fusarium zealandicum TaxID=1053134 RepID=A0A8H4UHX5_9HYPO|nr:hypothetical protein FZEAL_6656 [Fusarium zealandicum]
MASSSARSQKLSLVACELGLIYSGNDDEEISYIKIENCVGFSKVPLGISGPLRIVGLGVDSKLYAPLVTYEATLVASCSRGCKAFDSYVGLQFEVLGDGMSRALVVVFQTPGSAVAFYHAIPTFQLEASTIRSNVHVFCNYTCGDACGQNMVTKATNYACRMLRQTYGDKFSIKDFVIEGQLASDKKPSWGNVNGSRGVQVMVWGVITLSVLACTTERMDEMHRIGKDGGIRNGHFGSNINTANIIAAMFISTGQDPGSIAEASWSHLTTELDKETGNLTMSLYFPSLTVGTVGGGTGYTTQREALGMLACLGPGKKHTLAGIIGSLALALDASTMAAICNDTFTDAHTC